jgi:hypothetical protein
MRRGVRLSKEVEEARQQLRGNAGTRIPYADFDQFLAAARHTNIYLAARLRVFRRVVQQIAVCRYRVESIPTVKDQCPKETLKNPRRRNGKA